MLETKQMGGGGDTEACTISIDDVYKAVYPSGFAMRIGENDDSTRKQWSFSRTKNAFFDADAYMSGSMCQLCFHEQSNR